MSVILTSLSFHANAETKSETIIFYGGVGLNACSTKSDFNMNYSLYKDNYTDECSYDYHKEILGRAYGEVFL